MEKTAFEDGIGRRRRATDPNGVDVEMLVLSRELVEAESSEALLLDRAAQLASFVHPAFAQVLRVERQAGGPAGLAVVSAAVPGTRLSEALRNAQRRFVAPDLDAARFILAQVAVAVADFHRLSREMSHGAIGPERIVVRPDGRVVIVEPILAPLLQQLQMARTPLWTEFRVPVPPVAGTARFDQITDVMQLGVLALALVLGRPIRRDEYPNRLHDLLMEASSADQLAERQPVSRALRSWIHRTLQLEPRSSFRTAAEAVAAFEAAAAEEPHHKLSPASVMKYLEACTSEATGGWKVPAILAVPPADDRGREPAHVDPPLTPPRVEPVAVARGRGGRARRVPARAQREPAETDLKTLVRRAGGAIRTPLDLARRLNWSSVRRAVRVSMLSVGLVALFGATYLGARGYLTLAGLAGGRGTLVVETSPAGVEVFVDGRASGRTPTTLDLPAGEHTLVLRTSRGITLVPVVVVSGARRVERVDIRQRSLIPRAPAPPARTPQSAPSNPQ